MKKLLALALALVMVLSLSVTAFAADINQDSDPKTGTTSVSYTVNPTYTVTIPASVTLGETVTVSASNVVVPKGKQLLVGIISNNDDDAFFVQTAEGEMLFYSVKKSGVSINIMVGDPVLKVNPENADNGSATLTFEEPTYVTYAGTYTGTVTFTVSVVSAAT